MACESRPRRLVRALWGETAPGTRGPKPTLNVDDVVVRAVELADRDGLGAVSMRSLARSLGYSTMALYTYVATRDDLISVMLDHAMAELTAEPVPDGSWREQVEALARRNWEWCLRHPWVLEQEHLRTGLGPNELAAAEQMLGVLSEGLAGADAVLTWQALTSFVRGSARRVLAAADGGGWDGAWWEDAVGAFEEIVPDPSERFPVLTRLRAEGAFDGDGGDYLEFEARRAFEHGLARLLDGLR
ncbi:MAG: TetR/AcrR family transcriptional regulator C-terminal domain-containing protein [Myxococcota bacterium]